MVNMDTVLINVAVTMPYYCV